MSCSMKSSLITLFFAIFINAETAVGISNVFTLYNVSTAIISENDRNLEKIIKVCAGETLYVTVPGNSIYSEIKIYNTEGKVVVDKISSIKNSGSVYSIDIDAKLGLAPGTYFVVLSNNKNKKMGKISQKFILVK